jgi:hypothetical protein
VISAHIKKLSVGVSDDPDDRILTFKTEGGAEVELRPSQAVEFIQSILDAIDYKEHAQGQVHRYIQGVHNATCPLVRELLRKEPPPVPQLSTTAPTGREGEE